MNDNNSDQRRYISEDLEQLSSKTSGDPLDGAAKLVPVPAAFTSTSTSATVPHQGTMLQAPPNHDQAEGMLAGVSSNNLQLLGAWGAAAQHNVVPGAQVDVAALMRENLMMEWQTRLNILALSSRNHQQHQSNNAILPARNAAAQEPSFLTAVGGGSKVRRAPPTGEGQPPTKKVRLHNNSLVVVDAVLPLTACERKVGFPAPPVFGPARIPAVRELTSFTKSWERLERLSDAMDDTAADQEAFVKEFFTRALYRQKSNNLYKRMQALKPKAHGRRRVTEHKE
jgi:hypothetical protein